MVPHTILNVSAWLVSPCWDTTDRGASRQIATYSAMVNASLRSSRASSAPSP